jgi:hypothetical protein
MAPGLLTVTAVTGNGFFNFNLFFHSTEFWAIKELDCEHVCSQLMDLGLLTATADTGSGFFPVNFIFSCEFWADHLLDCEHVSSQLMAPGLLTATAGTGSGYFRWILIFLKQNSELPVSLIVSIWAYNWYPLAWSQPVPVVDFCLKILSLSTEFWADGHWVLSWPSAWLWACMLIAHCPRLAHSHLGMS